MLGRNIETLIRNSNELMKFTLSMRMATKYTCDNNFNLEYYAMVIGKAREELEEIQKNILVDKETGEIME